MGICSGIVLTRTELFRPNKRMEVSEEDLVQAAVQGSETAFESLVLKYRELIIGISRRYFRQVPDAEDVAQEAFIRAFQKLGTLKKGVPFRNWLIRITINLCIDRLRQKRRKPEQPISEITERGIEWLERGLNRGEFQTQRGPEDEIQARELLGAVLPELEAQDQVLLRLLYGEELGIPEVADRLGWSQVNVRVRAYRARRRLKAALEKLLDRGGG